MNLKLLAGIALFVVGLATALAGIAGVGEDVQAGGYAIPIIAGLSLALGGLLMGLSLGDWKHPRTHLERGDEVVDPEGYHKMKHV
jgi:predicted small secreted protein